MKVSRVVLLTLVGISAAAVGCKSESGAPAGDEPPAVPAVPAAPPVPAASAAPVPAASAAPAAAGAIAISQEARDIFNQRCVTCHGQSGKGDGPAGGALNPKPRDWTDKAWHATVTDDVIRKAVVEGGAAIGKSPMMPPNPDLVGKAAVADDLVKLVRSFGK